MSLYHTVAPLDKGVQVNRRPHLIDSGAWTIMQQMRSRRGIVENSPGWTTILSSGSLGGAFCSLITLYEKFVGSKALIAGGPSKIYSYSPATQQLTDISGALSFGSTRDDPWFAFAYLDELYVVNLIDGMFKYTGSGSLAAVANAPKARSGTILKDYVCVLHTISSPQQFKWCAEGAPTNWTTGDSGSFSLASTSDIGVALYLFGDDVIAYKEKSMYPIAFIGGSEVFGRRLGLKVGLLGPYALARLDNPESHLLMGPDTFYLYSGGNLADDSVGDEIRDKVYGDLHPTLRNRARALYLRQGAQNDVQEIIFAYPSRSATADADLAVMYSIKEKSWSGPFTFKCSMLGYGVTTIGDITQVFGDNVGNLLQIGASQDDNGAAIERILESGDYLVTRGARTSGGRIVELPADTVVQLEALNIETEDSGDTGNAQLTVGTRMDLNDSISWSSAFNVPLGASHSLRVPMRLTGRWFRVHLVVSTSKKLNLVGYQYEFNPVGRR